MTTAFTHARLGKEASQTLINAAHLPVLKREIDMFDAYVRVDLAHVTMMAEQGIIPAEVAKDLLGALLDLRRAGPNGLDINGGLGSILLQVEHYLAERVGKKTSGYLQLARSRIDQNATISRVHARDELLKVAERIVDFQKVILKRAEEWAGVLMPGYTHLQHAQPWLLGHYMIGQHDVFQRDLQRVMQTYERVNLSSLGGLALAGTSWPIDRERSAYLLGHTAPIRHSKDCAGFAMDYLAEVGSSLSILMSGLGRLASEWYIWSTWEFRLIELDEGLCGTSSIMPQKKNPYVLERVRALSGESIGWTPAQLGMLRTPTTVDADRFFSTGNVEYFRVANWTLDLMEECVATVRINRERMKELAGANWNTASNLADVMVRECGMDFRSAHQVVGALVKNSLEADLHSSKVGSAEVNLAAQTVLGADIALTDQQIHDALDPDHFVATRRSRGSLSATELEKLFELASSDIAESERGLSAERARLDESEHALMDAMKKIGIAT